MSDEQNPQDNIDGIPPDAGQDGGIPAGSDGDLNAQPGQQQVQDEVPDNIKQYFKSGFGRLQAELNTRLDELNQNLNRGQQFQQQFGGQQQANPVQKINDMLAEKFYSGDMFGFLELYNNIKTNQRQYMNQAQETNLKRAFLNFKDKEGFESVFPEMEKRARELVAKGHAPEAAAELGYLNAFLDYKNGKLPAHNLGLMGGGRRTPGKKRQPELPSEYKRIMDRGIRDGIFKDKDDYIASLSPQTRKQLGFE